MDKLELPFPAFGLGRFSVAGCTPFMGVVLEDSAMALQALAPLAQRMGAVWPCPVEQSPFEQWPALFDVLSRVIAEFAEDEAFESAKIPLERLRIHAPFQPRQAFCTIANYRSGAVQARLDAARAAAIEACEQRLRDGQPYVSNKLPTSVIGPFDAIALPAHVRQPDWEVELGVVIGKEARNVKREDAMSCVAGYTVVNDITVRELVSRHEPQGMGTDWLQAKNAPGFLPVGPWVVPAAFVPDPYALRMTLRLNGELMQDEKTGDMIFDIAAQIEYVSRHVRLLPGDLLCTGAPAGFGLHYGRFLEPGDMVQAGIDGLGGQRNECRREGAA
jgi:2-keto-4-pentenoate hydratase/2-oxohepta-3-ene-1,7-dioic acid hydratase in catechol pathway